MCFRREFFINIQAITVPYLLQYHIILNHFKFLIQGHKWFIPFMKNIAQQIR